MQANHSVVPGLDPASTAHAIRAAIGDEVDLMLDVGLIWDAKTTLQRARLSRAAGDQPQLHDRHQRRRFAAFPGERAERVHHGVPRRAIGDRPALAKNPIPIVDGHAAVPEERGLGVGPDPVIIEQYLVRD
jgi:L-alanine-DL-glutamate epimerase-like enolase superfamily enzyme